MTKAVKLARAVGTGGVLEDGEIQAAQVTGLATVASTNSYTDLINKPTIPSITGLASQTYVNTQINNLINNAPGTLDTLKEIADQLALDQSAVGALTTVVNSKANTSSLATVATTGSYTDLINKPAGGTTYLRKIANYTAADRDGIIADTTAGVFTVFLPATPTVGMQVSIVDGGNWGVNPLTIGRNGSTIEGLSENLVLDIAGVSVQLIYDGTTWEIFAQAGVLSANTVPASSISGLATVATSGSYADLTNKPTLFSGSYTDLTNKPVVATLKVSSIAYPGDDLAADPAGGQTITLTGTGFTAGLSVLVNTTMAAVVTVVSSTSVTFTAPAMAAGTYVLYLVATDGSVALSLPGISYSGVPAWSTTAGTLGTQYETTAISKSLSASGDGTVSYSLVSGTLPPGSSLNTSTGTISGTAPATNSSTTYNFTIRATDAQNQDTDRAFSITLDPDSVSWSSPATNLTVTASFGDAYSQALAATSVAGNSISYSSTQLPTGITLSGSNLTGTFNAEETVNTTVTATAANTNRTATRTVTFTIIAPGEPFFKNVTLLLTGNGTNGAQNNTFLDSSPNNFTITRVGNTSQGSFSPYGNTWSNYFNGSSYLQSSATTAVNFGTGNFTVEFWMYANSASTSQDLFGDANNSGGLGIALYSNTFYYGDQGISNIFGIEFTNYYNQWLHVAITRNNGTSRIFFNGVLISTASDSINYSNSTGVLVGKFTGRNNYIDGYLSNIRVVKGTALYTSAFTPSTTPLTAVSGTSFLTCQSNRFVDNSTNAFTVSVAGGSPSVKRFNPFGASSNSAYSASVIGGSAYFDDSSDYLTSTAPAIGTGNTTVEFWIYPLDGTTTYNCVYDSRISGGDITSGFGVFQYGNVIEVYQSSLVVASAAGSIAINAWNHVALVRNSGTCQLYVNGVASGTSNSNTTNLTSTERKIASAVTSPFNYFGYISDLRETSSALYTSTFTIPTTPRTSVTNTNLLLNFINASIIDNSMVNDIETVGNAQISTAVKKFGTGSLAFDGTGDYLSTRSTAALALGSGDFTIECWAYANSLGSYNALLAQWPDNNGTVNNSYVLESVGSNMQFYWVEGTTLYGPATLGTIETGSWIHWAICRSGNTLYPFKNGVAGTSVSISQTLNSPVSPITIGGQVAGAGYWNGYIDDLRVTKGYARYAAPIASIKNTTASSTRGTPLQAFFSESYGVFAGYQAGEYLVVDFGSSVSNVTTTYKNGVGNQWAPTSVLIQTSDNNSSWTTVVTHSDSGNTSLQTITSSGSGRYWRMYQNSNTRANSSGYEWHFGKFSMSAPNWTGFTPPTEAFKLK
jgi:hypothetical protein